MAIVSSIDETEAVRNFVVYVDTNTIWTKEDTVELLPADFRDRWERLSRPGDVQLRIPNIVVRELAYQRERHFTRQWQEARAAVERVNSALELAIPGVPKVERQRVRSAVLAKLRKELKETSYCQEAPVPYKHVSEMLMEIVAASVWRSPPFKDKGEAGFRDALILETVRHGHAEEPHSDIAFITRDERLMAAAQERFKGFSNFGLFSTLDDYEKFLSLARTRFTPEFLHAITSKAGAVFEDKAWQQLGLAASITGRYELTIGSSAWDSHPARDEGALAGLGGLGGVGGLLGFGRMRQCAGEPEFHFLNTELVGVVGSNEFHWSTKVLILTPYSGRPKTLLGGALAVESDVLYVRLLHIAVEWRAAVSQEQEFSELGLIREEKEFDGFIEHDKGASPFSQAL
jgi:predicted nucleic acid-binding protein